MKNSFFTKMAWRNIQSNGKLYMPYVISAVLSVALFQMMASLMTNDFVRQRSVTLPTLFGMGTVVIGLFSLIFIFYINSFLMKRRKKEVGLYSVLGLEKRHVANILIIESLILSGASIFVGILTGIVFGRLNFLILNYLLRLPDAMSYSTSWKMTGITVLLFTGIFTLTLIYNIIQVTLSNPIRLLKGSKEGEKEPKSSPILFVIGLLSLGAGYYISLTIDNPISVLNQFFVAVLLVIIGTYLLFTAGSIIVLKALKRNKVFYYKPGPFISISGMLYRMKQHAAGLANISILSVMVIIAVSTTITLYAGTEETLENRFPEENNLTIRTDENMGSRELEETVNTIQDDLKSLSSNKGYKMTDQYFYRYTTLFGKLKDKEIVFGNFNFTSDAPTMVMIIPLEDYNQLSNKSIELNDHELLYHKSDEKLKGDTLTLFETTYDLREINQMPENLIGSNNIVDTLLLVTPDNSTLDTFLNHHNNAFPQRPNSLTADIYWSLKDDQTDEAYSGLIQERLREADYPVETAYESRDANRAEWYSINGGFLFIGIFLGGLFTIGAILITYYKQISEGYEDRNRIQIMQKVGLDKKTTKQATKAQVFWMFSLPIFTAAIHTAFAYPIVQKLLVLFNIYNNKLFLGITVGVVLIYSLIYWIIYRVTTKKYLNIVE
ncbi:FtsX-like permease family protein [Alkalibacterium kapii]|uniref:ABC transporter permease n=1 Tax=Alkalibacterium kapii TaxID=426704 RepID=A0A511AUW5_9LACT|nr:FtsX-like permease family protein [Alkalibacterium kapii]GEK91934.1 ABC transporter permease [Alkalibacterium kapii]